MTNSTVSLTSWERAWQEKARRDPADPWPWAMAHRRVGERSLIHPHPLADIARDDHPLVVVMKSAQVGLTELEVNLALHAADTGHAGRGNVLFLMPNQNQMDDFARSKRDRAIQDSPYLRQRLQPEPPRPRARTACA